jgi:putative membrane protein
MYKREGFEHLGFMWLWRIIGIVFIVAVTWALVNALRGRNDHAPTVEEILKRRYARGEIDKDEYQERLQDLRQ